jgi:hypothetical protein
MVQSNLCEKSSPTVLAIFGNQSLELVSASAGGIGAHLCDIVPPREKFRSHFSKHEKSARIAVMLKVAPIQESLEIAGQVQSSGKSPVLGVELR